MNNDLHQLPKFRDRQAFLYIEHAKIEQEQKSIAIYDASGYTPVPIASIAFLTLGPGTTITHAAISALAKNNCLVIWSGEENVRFYASGMGGTRSAIHLLHQAQLASQEESRLEIAKRMYLCRFDSEVPEDATIQTLRGMEGVRIRETYAVLSDAYGVTWTGRSYRRDSWYDTDPINRALSAANSCLYGLCHAAILSAGYSPAIGFVHNGKQLSFVYDIADLYKTEIVFPIAFEIAAEGGEKISSRVRHACREKFHQEKLIKNIIPDIRTLLGEPPATEVSPFDSDEALPADLWEPETEKPH